MRMSRRAGLLNTLKLPTLRELIADASLVGSDGANYASTHTAQFRFPKNTSVYLFDFHGEGYQIGKMYNQTFAKFIGDDAAPQLKNYSSTEIVVKVDMCAGAIVGLQFPSFPDKIVDAVLSKTNQASVLAVADDERGTQSVLNTAFASDGLYVVAFSGPRFSISASDSLFSAIFSYPDSRAYLYRSGTRTYLSSNGTSATSTLYGGRISRLY